MVTVIHGVVRCDIPFDGQTVEKIRQAAKKRLAIPDDTLARVNGKPAKLSRVLHRGDRIEFINPHRKTEVID